MCIVTIIRIIIIVVVIVIIFAGKSCGLCSENVVYTIVIAVCQCFNFLYLCLPGLKEKTEHRLKVVEAKNRKLTPWQEYKEKRARKKLQKKEAKMVS